jgi:hypothetical protein
MIFADSLGAPELMYTIVAVSGGIIMLGWGIRFFRTVVALSGFASSAMIAFIVLANVQDRVGLGRHAKAIMMGGSLAAGVAGAALGLWLWMVALGAVGGLGGLCASLWVLSWPLIRSKKYVEGPVERPLFIAGAALCGCCLALVFEKAVIVAGTALTGALAICSGLDVILQSGLNDELGATIINKTISKTVEPRTMAMLVSIGALFLIGVLFQYRVSGRERGRKGWSKNIKE